MYLYINTRLWPEITLATTQRFHIFCFIFLCCLLSFMLDVNNCVVNWYIWRSILCAHHNIWITHGRTSVKLFFVAARNLIIVHIIWLGNIVSVMLLAGFLLKEGPWRVVGVCNLVAWFSRGLIGTAELGLIGMALPYFQTSSNKLLFLRWKKLVIGDIFRADQANLEGRGNSNGWQVITTTYIRWSID